ncbi:MAG: hypothetical protein WC492_00040 [Candidatus Micrarchaeia archaeon]
MSNEVNQVNQVIPAGSSAEKTAIIGSSAMRDFNNRFRDANGPMGRHNGNPVNVPASAIAAKQPLVSRR